MKVGWIGLGNMGVPMVRNVADKGIEVDAYNRTPKGNLDIGNACCRTTIGEAVRDKDLVVVMVSNGDAVRDVLFGQGALQEMNWGTVVVNMSTIGVDETMAIAEQLASNGLGYLDAPVLGSVKPATDGTLTVVAGGSPDDFEKAKPLFEAVSKATFHIGDTGKGATMKLLVNSFLGMCVEALGETLTYGATNHLTADIVMQVLENSAVWSPMLAGKREMVLADDFPAQFALRHLVKDLSLALRQAKSTDVELPAIETTYGVLKDAVDNGYGDDDMIAVIHHLRNEVVGG